MESRPREMHWRNQRGAREAIGQRALPRHQKLGAIRTQNAIPKVRARKLSSGRKGSRKN